MKLLVEITAADCVAIPVHPELGKRRVPVIAVHPGGDSITQNIAPRKNIFFKTALFIGRLDLPEDNRALISEKIKKVVIAMIRHADELPVINFSDYISKELALDYNYISGIFSALQGYTIQQFIIFHKIERVKELLRSSGLTLTEISLLLQYSSVCHLSNQFKKVTGCTPSHFLQSGNGV